MKDEPNLPSETVNEDGTPKLPDEPGAGAQPKPEETIEYWQKRTADAETKFSNSSSEANLLREAEAARVKAAQELTKEPTESDLKAAFPEWESLTPIEQSLARRAYTAERIATSADQRSRALQSDREWNTSIELAASSDPALQGKEHDFRQFASKSQYRDVPLDVLVSAFLQKFGGAPAAPKPTPKPGLLTGTGGPKTTDKPKKYAAEDLKNLRETDYRKYLAVIKSGQYEDGI